MPLTVGDYVPDSQAALTPGLPDLRGQWTVLYFYPQGNNPHCVMQSRRFQALAPEFERLGVRLIGVSVDTAEEQRSFRNLCSVSFPLVSDAGHAISRTYGVLQTTEHEGQMITYARRETFLVDPAGQIVQHWTQVDPNTHAQEVLDQVRNTLESSA